MTYCVHQVFVHIEKKLTHQSVWKQLSLEGQKVTEILKKIPHSPRPAPPNWWVSFFLGSPPCGFHSSFLQLPTWKILCLFFDQARLQVAPNWNHTHQHAMVKGTPLRWESNYLWSTCSFFFFFFFYFIFKFGTWWGGNL